LRALLAAGLAPMRALSELVRQSCNLSVLDAGAVRVIAQVESPADFGYRVRVGAVFPADATATGAVLTGGAPQLRHDDPLQAGITDLVVAVLDGRGAARAALTVPYVATSFSATGVDEVMAAATRTASEIAGRLAGDSHTSGR
jgi:DNA-binding IclR family transcriptional regulator